MFDADAVQASVDGEIAFACSDADPYNPAGAQVLYGDTLGITATVVEGGATSRRTLVSAAGRSRPSGVADTGITEPG